MPLVTRHLLLGCGLYYGVLTFNLDHHILDWRILSSVWSAS